MYYFAVGKMKKLRGQTVHWSEAIDKYMIVTCCESTVCPVSSDPFFIVTYCIEWVPTSWTHSIYRRKSKICKMAEWHNKVGGPWIYKFSRLQCEPDDCTGQNKFPSCPKLFPLFASKTCSGSNWIPTKRFHYFRE